MKLIRARQPSGIALIIVMIAVVSLTLLAGAFAYSMKVEGRLAINSNNDEELAWMGRSGVEAAKYVLGLDMQAGCGDSLSSVWAGGIGCPGISNTPLAEIHLPWTLPLGNGQVTVHPMVDLERKANINMANEAMIEQSLVLMGVDAGDYPAIVNSILDWIDPDDAERIQGAESDYYQTFDPPYFAKNGPIDDMSELLLIRGIRENPDLFYGPSANAAMPNRVLKDAHPRLGFNADQPTYPVGLLDLFTPISAGRININTAKSEVLQLIPFVDERAAAEIIRLRTGEDGADGTEDDVPYRNPGEVINAIPNPQLVGQLGGFCDVRSRTFEVRITAEIAGYKRNFVAIVVRNNPRDIQTVSFHSVEEFNK